METMVSASSEMTLNTLKELKYKVLLRNYECELGEIDFIAKKDGFLVFVTIDKDLKKAEAVARYYIKRYGIQDVPYRIVSL